MTGNGRSLYCKCGNPTWSSPDHGQTWIHPKCGLPSEGAEVARIGLNFFRGGELDGKVYETKTITSLEGLTLPLDEYRWTPEVVTSERTGQQARVWVHRDIAESEQTPANREESAPVSEATSAEAPPVQTTDGAGKRSKNPENKPADPRQAELLQRRKTLKLSRKDAAEGLGVQQSVIVRLEWEFRTPRTKDEELNQYDEWLKARENGEAPAAAVAPPADQAEGEQPAAEAQQGDDIPAPPVFGGEAASTGPTSEAINAEDDPMNLAPEHATQEEAPVQIDATHGELPDQEDLLAAPSE